MQPSKVNFFFSYQFSRFSRQRIFLGTKICSQRNCQSTFRYGLASFGRSYSVNFVLAWLPLKVCTLFFYKNVVFPTQAEYSYFSADFRLKIFLYYS